MILHLAHLLDDIVHSLCVVSTLMSKAQQTYSAGRLFSSTSVYFSSYQLCYIFTKADVFVPKFVYASYTYYT